MPYRTYDGDEIDPNDIPIPDLCRLCSQFIEPGTVPSPCNAESLTSDDVLDESMQVVHCTLTRLDHMIRQEKEDAADPPPTPPASSSASKDSRKSTVRESRRERGLPFTCGAFRSRFGTDAIWH
jgi:hypothetical protein